MVTCNRRQVVGGLGSIGLGATLFGCLGMARAADKIAIDEASVLIVVDVQNCFLPGGSLAVKDGDQVILNPPVDLTDGHKVQIRPGPPAQLTLAMIAVNTQRMCWGKLSRRTS